MGIDLELAVEWESRGGVDGAEEPADASSTSLGLICRRGGPTCEVSALQMSAESTHLHLDELIQIEQPVVVDVRLPKHLLQLLLRVLWRQTARLSSHTAHRPTTHALPNLRAPNHAACARDVL